jgi:hypothetical protein
MCTTVLHPLYERFSAQFWGDTGSMKAQSVDRDDLVHGLTLQRKGDPGSFGSATIFHAAILFYLNLAIRLRGLERLGMGPLNLVVDINVLPSQPLGLPQPLEASPVQRKKEKLARSVRGEAWVWSTTPTTLLARATRASSTRVDWG